MTDEERVVARFNDGRVLKGYTKGFTAESPVVVIDEAGSGKEHRIAVADLKPVFFIKSFEGNKKYRGKKPSASACTMDIRCTSNLMTKSLLCGFVEGEIPWDKRFFVSREGSQVQGFFLIPVDRDSNNVKVLVFGTLVKDVTIMMKVKYSEVKSGAEAG